MQQAGAELGQAQLQMAHSVSKSYISGTECPIHLKLGCKFKFVHCLETYLKINNLDHEGTLQDPILPRFP